MTTMTRRLIAACAALTLAAAPLIAQQRGESSKDGIKVHGHWTIDVRKADGTLVSHHEFENALVGTGGMGLGLILSRGYTMGGWVVLLDGGACQGPLTPFCVIAEPTTGAGEWDNNDLNVSVPQPPDTNAGLLVLKGSVKAAVAGQLSSVRTRLHTCGPDFDINKGGWYELTESQCAAKAGLDLAGNVFDLTSRTLGTPIPVTAGQLIQVTVVLSFS